MKTKRDVLKDFITNRNCNHIVCESCPYSTNNNHDCKLLAGDRLSQIGAMAVLRMFPEKKKPLLSIGTKVRFDDGSIARIESTTAGPELSFRTINGYTSRSLSYLLGRTWEVVE